MLLLLWSTINTISIKELRKGNYILHCTKIIRVYHTPIGYQSYVRHAKSFKGRSYFRDVISSRIQVSCLLTLDGLNTKARHFTSFAPTPPSLI